MLLPRKWLHHSTHPPKRKRQLSTEKHPGKTMPYLDLLRYIRLEFMNVSWILYRHMICCVYIHIYNILFILGFVWKQGMQFIMFPEHHAAPFLAGVEKSPRPSICSCSFGFLSCWFPSLCLPQCITLPTISKGPAAKDIHNNINLHKSNFSDLTMLYDCWGSYPNIY